MSFLKPLVIFYDTLRLYFSSSKITYFQQNSPSKCKFSDFLLLELKFTKLLMSFFKQKGSFSSKFESLLSVMRDNFPVFFQQKLYMLLTKEAYQSANFEIVTVCIKIYQIFHVIFGTKSQFFFKLCITLKCHEM